MNPYILSGSAQIMSSIYDNSVLLIMRLTTGISTLSDYGQIEYNRNVLKAMQPLRAQVGSLYHMEGWAKLTLAHTIVHGIVSCLLLMK